ncbi:MAG: Fic family protein [Verrucomicrobia bacterium]|nr:Fic family protein [Verrucomicrobiota bacterium]
MARNPSSEDASTRWIETSRGILRYSELAPLLAERVLRVQQRIEAEHYAPGPPDEELLCRLHRDFCGDLVPDWAGKWRTIEVRVGAHIPPKPHEVPLLMRDYARDLEARLADAPEPSSLPELLAVAEGRLLSIHPFADFNGRVTRLWLWELLRRLRLPPVSLVPEAAEASAGYLAALRAADAKDYRPLIRLWTERLAETGRDFTP